MMKQRSRLLAMLCAVIFLFGTVTIYATSYGITAEITTSKIKASYEYGTGGNNVMVKLDFEEKHSQTGQVYSSSCSNTVVGIYTKATQSRNADTGYQYTTMDVFGYVNSVQMAKLLDCTP